MSEAANLKTNLLHYDREIARVESARASMRMRHASDAFKLTQDQRAEYEPLGEELRTLNERRSEVIGALIDLKIAEAEEAKK
jgi:hypothetical protein